MDLRNSHVVQGYYQFLNKILIRKLENSYFSANQLTLIGVAMAVCVPFGFYINPAVGFIFLLLSAVADSADGLLARQRQTQSTFGAFLDSTVDRVSDFFFLSGIWVLFWFHSSAQFISTLVIYSAFMFTVLISYTKARIEGLGQSCSTGLMDRFMRTLYLLVWTLLLAVLPVAFTQILWWGLLVFWLLTLFTVYQRVNHARKVLKANPPG